MSTELISLDGITAAVLFDPKNDQMDIALEKLEKAALAEVMDGSTPEGRKRCTRHKNSVVQIQKVFDTLKKSQTKELKDLTKAIDSKGRQADLKCEELKAKIMAPKIAYDKAEAERIQNHEKAIEYIEELGSPLLAMEDNEASLKSALTNLDKLSLAIVDDSYEEFEKDAQKIHLEATHKVNLLVNDYTKRIADAKELEELKADKAKRDEEEKAEALRLEGEKRAEDKLKAEQEAKLKAADDEREAAIKEAGLKLSQSETEPTYDDGPIVAVSSREELAPVEYTFSAPPIPDKSQEREHKNSVNIDAFTALVKHCYLTDDEAKRVITKIAQGYIPKININYE